jgi:hypothetical protein
MLTESFRPAAMAFFGEAVPTAQRKSAFAVYRLAINLGMAIGPRSAASSPRSPFAGSSSRTARRHRGGDRPDPRSRSAGPRSAFADPTTATRIRSTAAHADPRFLFFLASVLP